MRMKALSAFLKVKNMERTRKMDEKTVFFLAEKAIESEYGRKGLQHIRPKSYSDGVLFLKVENSVWANEIALQSEEIARIMNDEIGGNDIRTIRVTRG